MSATVKNNFQEYDPRHRLTGAVVLILLAIILLPMLLSKDQDVPEPEVDPVVMEVTKEGKKVFVSRISSATAPNEKPAAEGQKAAVNSSPPAKASVEKGDDKDSSALFKPMSSADVKKSSATKSASADKKSSEATTKKIFTKEPAVKSTTTTPAANTATKTTSAKTTTSKTTKTAPNKTSAAVADGGWMLQVGVFSQSSNANNKVAELKKKGFDAKTARVKTSKGTATKVWIGPFKDRASAEKMQERLQHKTRQRGMVVKN